MRNEDELDEINGMNPTLFLVFAFSEKPLPTGDLRLFGKQINFNLFHLFSKRKYSCFTLPSCLSACIKREIREITYLWN